MNPDQAHLPIVHPEKSWRDEMTAILDVETTGLCPWTDRIIELSVVLGVPSEEGVLARRSWLIDPGIPISEEVSKVHGITDAMVNGCPRFQDIAVEVIATIEPAPVVGAYNHRFDRDFLVAEVLRSGLTVPRFLHSSVGWVDPLPYARLFQRYEKGGKTLAKVAERLGVSAEGDGHRASHDAELALRVLQKFQHRMPETIEEMIQVQMMLLYEEKGRMDRFFYEHPERSRGGP